MKNRIVMAMLVVAALAGMIYAYDGPQIDVSRVLGGYFTATADRTTFTDSTGNAGSQALRITATGGLEVQGPKASGAAKLGNPVLVGGQDGTNVVTLKTDSGGELQVDVTSSVTTGDVAHDAADSGAPVKIGGKGSAAVASDVTEGDRVNASFTLAGRLRTEVGGDVAHDAADAGNPIKIGAIGRSVWETAASTAADRVNLSADLFGRLRTDGGGYAAADAWYIQHAPAANTQATISKAAGAAGVKHVCTGFSWSLSSGAGAPTPELITIVIRDGATGAGTVMWTETVSLPATAGSSARGGQSGLWLVGTAATALTIETDSAPGANVVANVSLQGVSIK